MFYVGLIMFSVVGVFLVANKRSKVKVRVRTAEYLRRKKLENEVYKLQSKKGGE